MGRYIIRRLLWVIVLLIVVSAVTFLIFYELPSADPAVIRAGKSPNPQLIAQIRHTLGLDKPVYVQYWSYMKQVVLHFNFGYSYQNSQPVRQEIFSRLPATISLTVGAVIVWLAIGLPIGIISAIKRRTVPGPDDDGRRAAGDLGSGLLAGAGRRCTCSPTTSA